MWDRMCFAAVKLSYECDARRNSFCQLDLACRCVASLVWVKGKCFWFLMRFRMFLCEVQNLVLGMVKDALVPCAVMLENRYIIGALSIGWNWPMCVASVAFVSIMLFPLARMIGINLW